MEQLLTKINNPLADLIIDNNYQIDDTLEWHEQLVLYIMRYRRIIGTIILIILLLIMKNCKWQQNNIEYVKEQKGGAALLPLAAGAVGSGGAASAASAAGSGGAAALASTMAKSVGSNVAQNLAKNAVTQGAATNSAGKLPTGKIAQFKAMRTAGMSRFASGLELTRQGGQYVADKFKQFASWLYEILFAIAISIAICMIVMPSIAFFALGLICYFLLRKKISSMKAF